MQSVSPLQNLLVKKEEMRDCLMRQNQITPFTPREKESLVSKNRQGHIVDLVRHHASHLHTRIKVLAMPFFSHKSVGSQTNIEVLQWK